MLKEKSITSFMNIRRRPPPDISSVEKKLYMHVNCVSLVVLFTNLSNVRSLFIAVASKVG